MRAPLRLFRCVFFSGSARAFLHRSVQRVRMWWWRGDNLLATALLPRYRALPGLPGWADRVQAVARADGLYVDPATGVAGCPPEWALVRREETGRWVSVTETCALSGETITGHPFTGVRCARCGVAIAVRFAGMRTSLDIPGCIPCRSFIRAAISDA